MTRTERDIEASRICVHGKLGGNCKLCRAWRPDARSMAPGWGVRQICGLPIREKRGAIRHGKCGLQTSKSAEIFVWSAVSRGITGSVLECGAGTGLVALSLAMRGCDATAMEKYFGTALNFLWNRIGYRGIKARIIAGDWAKPKKMITQFDNVICCDPCESVPELVEFMRIMWTGKGQAIICDPGRFREIKGMKLGQVIEHDQFATNVWSL